MEIWQKKTENIQVATRFQNSWHCAFSSFMCSVRPIELTFVLIASAATCTKTKICCAEFLKSSIQLKHKSSRQMQMTKTTTKIPTKNRRIYSLSLCPSLFSFLFGDFVSSLGETGWRSRRTAYHWCNKWSKNVWSTVCRVMEDRSDFYSLFAIRANVWKWITQK